MSATILWICAVVVAAVFAVMIHSIATFGRERGAPARPGALAEILWAIVPIFIMVSTALPAVRMLTDDPAPTARAHDPLFTPAAASYNADRK